MWEMAGSPETGSSGVSSTRTSARRGRGTRPTEAAGGPERRFGGRPSGSKAVPCRAVWIPTIRNGQAARWLSEQAGQRAADVAESEEGEPQNSIFSIRELRSDSSAARCSSAARPAGRAAGRGESPGRPVAAAYCCTCSCCPATRFRLSMFWRRRPWSRLQVGDLPVVARRWRRRSPRSGASRPACSQLRARGFAQALFWT